MAFVVGDDVIHLRFVVISCFVLTTLVSVVAAEEEEGTPLSSEDHQPGSRFSSVDMDYEAIESLHETDDDLGRSNSIRQHEFRISVASGTSQCFFQKLPANAQLHVSFQVVRGLDRNIEFLITGPGNLVLEHIEWTTDASIQKAIPVEGLYRLCLKNEKSQFSSKLIYFYLVTYTDEDMHHKTKTVLDLLDGTQVIKGSLETVEIRMKQVNMEQALSRRHVISDWYRLKDNNSYVQMMSIILCCIIVVSSAFQVFFVRRLFSAATSKRKPRA